MSKRLSCSSLTLKTIANQNVGHRLHMWDVGQGTEMLIAWSPYWKTSFTLHVEMGEIISIKKK